MENFLSAIETAKKSNIFLSVVITLSIVSFISPYSASAQDPAHAQQVRQLYNKALSDGRCYAWLETLCKQVGHRLSGSAAMDKAVQWSKSTLDTLHLDSVWLQPVMVPHWERGKKEEIKVLAGGASSKGYDLKALALGGSVGTAGKTISGEVVEARSWSDLEKLGRAGIEGKIVLFNRPMDPTKIRSFDAYGGAVDQRVSGASKAAQYGAIAVLVRSMTQRLDDQPHTGSLRYDADIPQIPAAAISTNDAEKLGKLLKKGTVKVSMRMDCRTLPDKQSYNVIGEIRGSEFPDHVILVGGHLDSWDVGEGAHDDGAGSVQSMDVVRLLRLSGYRPRHTIRCVLFANEENGLRGGKQYAEEAKRKGEHHVLAIETDAGGFTPRGFTFDAADAVFDSLFEQQIVPLRPYFEPYNLTLNKGGGGADIGPLKSHNGLLSGYYPDSQRYFDYHHTPADVFEAVSQRELELGSASMAALVYLFDRLR